MGSKQIAVVGGGLTGLVAAYRLSTAMPSARITLFEGSNRVGGWMRSDRRQVRIPDQDGTETSGEVVLEAGPRSIRPRGSRGAAAMLKLIRDVGLTEAIIPIAKSHPAAKNRFLLDTSTNELTKLPSGLGSVLRRQPKLLRGLVPNVAMEVFRTRRSIPSSPPASAAYEDESVDAFFRRRFGPDIADNLASAMVHGIYAASSAELSLRSTFGIMWDAEEKYGSVVLGMMRGVKSAEEKAQEQREWDELGELGKAREGWALYGLQGGLETLVNRLQDVIIRRGVDIRPYSPIKSIYLDPSGGDSGAIGITTADGTTSASHLVSAVLPSRLSTLLPATFPQRDLLTANASTSVGVVNLVFPLPSSAIHPPGFGYLIPRSTGDANPEGILGVIFDSTAVPLPQEAGLGVTKLTVMMGGPYWSTYPCGADGRPFPRPQKGDDLVAPALRHLRRVFPHLEGVEPLITRANLQLDCIPTYAPGHGGRMRDLHRAIVSSPWAGKISLAGNGYGGVGVSDCVWSAEGIVQGLVTNQPNTGLERFAIDV